MSTVINFKRPRPDTLDLEILKTRCWRSWFNTQTIPTEIVEALIEKIELLQADLASEHRLMIIYSNREVAMRRKLRNVGAIADHEEITYLDAIERLAQKRDESHARLARAELHAEIYETMYDTRHAERNACIVKSRAHLANIRKAIDWLWGFYDGNSLRATGV